ncbi:TolB family protein [Streptomyces sp. NPDC055749]
MTLCPLSLRARIAALTAATAVLAAVAVGYTVEAADGQDRTSASSGAPGVTLDNSPGVYHRSRSGSVLSTPHRTSATGPAKRVRSRDTGLSCHRFHASGRTAVCLATAPGIPRKTKVTVLDRDLDSRRTVVVGGIPNRARVSPSGRMVAWTLFVSGDSYASSSFSTRSGILDTRTGYLIKNVETLQLYLDGRRYHAPDVNYWGITFADDDNRFYATVSTKGKTYLVEGDMKAWKARTLRQNVECPSLSPDGTRIAFKKRVREGIRDPWRLHVLDLRTMRETPLAETRSVDDQAAWLDESTLAYALPGRAKGVSDVWTVPADGSHTEPGLLLSDASSPSMVPGSAGKG